MIPDLHLLAWLLYALCALLVAVFDFWLIRPQRLAEADGPRAVASVRRTRIVAAVMLVCCVASGTTLLGMGGGQRWPLFVGMVGASLLGASLLGGAGLVPRRRGRA